MVDDLLDQSDDAPVVRLINALLLEAIKESASDIHVETQERRLVVRFRVDGILREVIEPQRALAPLLVSRIKVMARLDIAEKRLPQDGRVSLRVGGHEVDVRISTIPSQYGERVVMRLLDRDATRLGLDRLGMSPPPTAPASSGCSPAPTASCSSTGPTGSGKTTTLYAALGQLNDRSRNIMTVEDPIEYSVDGVGQTQVNPRTDLTFARGLRAILRQDPDVIMVGEIRDRETAQIAVEAAMTGHFVLSTLHTNTAVGAVARLIDMGVERFLLAPMLAGVVAQRLVRQLCPDCARPDVGRARPTATCSTARSRSAPPLRRAAGCPACHGLGYRGRTGIYEVVTVDRRDGGDDPRRRRRGRAGRAGAPPRAEPGRGRRAQDPRRRHHRRGRRPGGPGALGVAAFTYRAVDRAASRSPACSRRRAPPPRGRTCAPAASCRSRSRPAARGASARRAGGGSLLARLRPAVGARDLTLITRQLATLIGSGVRIEDALQDGGAAEPAARGGGAPERAGRGARRPQPRPGAGGVSGRLLRLLPRLGASPASSRASSTR